MMDERMSASITCRLCGGSAKVVFRATILNRYDVKYFRCDQCGSLQTELPYWLDHAYSNGESRGTYDTGAVSRSRRTCAVILAAYRLGRLTGPTLDFGGGTGLLCRMIRDANIDAYTFDEYADGGFAKGFKSTIADKEFELVSAIEVMEHLPFPGDTIEKIFRARPKIVIATTMRYRGQGPDWDYLSLFTGTHVFFYSPKAIAWIASRYGYRVIDVGEFIIFIQEGLGRMTNLMLGFLRGPTIKLSDYLIPLQSRWGAYIDGERMRERYPNGVV